MLAYSDIDSLISFVNTEIPMTTAKYGVSDGKGGYIPNTYIAIDESIPPLFGYQPYEEGDIDQVNKGYVLYAGATATDYPQYAHNQVFDSSQFPALLQGLWAASNGNTQPAIFTQSLPVLPNGWFGITGGKKVTVVWCYLNARLRLDQLVPEQSGRRRDHRQRRLAGQFPALQHDRHQPQRDRDQPAVRAHGLVRRLRRHGEPHFFELVQRPDGGNRPGRTNG